MKKYFHTFGFLLIIFGCLGGIILDPLIFLITLIGVILVFMSNQKLLIKLLTLILIPAIIIFLIFHHFMKHLC